MLANKSNVCSLVSYVVLVVLFVFSAGQVGAQTPSAPAEKLNTVTPASAPEESPAGSASSPVAPVAIVTSDANATKSLVDPVRSEATLMNAKADEPTKSAPIGTEPQPSPAPAQCQRSITADVVAIPQPLMLNRLGAAIPGGMIFALRRDTVGGLGKQLRADKRPRPIVLRANVGDCLTVKFENSIPPANFISPPPPATVTSTTSEVSLHVQGMEWVTGTGDDGSFVGKNNSSLASAIPIPPNMPPAAQTYTLFAKAEGTFLLYTLGDTSSTGNQLTNGLFGALNVQPAGAEWYRSQVSQKDLKLVTKGTTSDGHPIIDYTKVYPAGSTYPDGTPIPANTPVLSMLDSNFNIVHTDLTAMITGPKAGRFPGTTGVNNPETNCGAGAPVPPPGINPLFCKNPASPDRKQPYREFTIIYHGGLGGVATQAFPILANAPANATQAQRDLASMTQAGQDAFAINYGTGGIGAEIYANRIGVGPMGNCIDCKFEEFFLSAWSVGDPAMLVDIPANANINLPLPPTPPQPPVKSPPPQCTAAELGDNNPPIPSESYCVNAKQLTGGLRTGTVTFSNGFATVTGTGTQFRTELALGDVLVLNGSPNIVRGTVKTITNDTQLVLKTNAAVSANGDYLVATPYKLTALPKATRVYYPDDPSNVYHSYINDHLKFRILHGGRDVTHVHHQHAHQWLQSPNSDESSYLDSQMISPGASYTLEMVYNGSGNRNKVVGDSIFHCHFYPHFAAGMWAMWRTHDVFEGGSLLVNGIPNQVKGSRALPDGEIMAGTPISAIVPLPTIPMAPMPSDVFIDQGQIVYGSPTGTTPTDAEKSGANVTVNPGFPFFIPGIAGARAPHPPLDFACTQKDPLGKCIPTTILDGGLPRHVVNGGTVAYESHDLKDWSKDLATMNAIKLPEDGTTVEKVAMTFFGQRCYPSFFPDGTLGTCPAAISTLPRSTLNTRPTGFRLNGLPLGPQQGAPFADPAVDDNGNAVGTKRVYQAAAIQADVAFNKKRWHYPQQRMLTLWKDVQLTIDATNGIAGGRPPEPLFFRGNSGDVIEYWHTNLVPNYYLVDDFQVRTPTDILGQHIHLVKFDVTSSDGAGNGFNYEDGTFSPGEVQEIIKAINHSPSKGFVNFPNVALTAPKPPPTDILDCSNAANANTQRCLPCPEAPSPINRPLCMSWLGAQTTVQRWYIDPLVDDINVDRTMRTVFTHDHFGPSTHQQAGLYAGLLIEPQGSTWKSNDGATPFGSRSDGGPTSWQAIITTTDPALSYREFALEFQDLQLAYSWATVVGTAGPKVKPSDDPKIGWTDPAYAINPPGTSTQAKPNLVSTGTANTPPGTQTVNYRNDPVAWRLGPDNDMSYIYDSALKQAGNAQPNGDPFTPLMRAYQNDNVQIRTLVGAHVFSHQFNLAGPTWFSEPAWKNSGYRSAQAMGLSEHFEMLFRVPSFSAPNNNRKCPDNMSQANCVDYLYSPSLDEFGITNGMWGLFRSYDPTQKADNLETIPQNSIGPPPTYPTCPAGLKPRVFNVTAVTTQKALASQPYLGNLVFNRGYPLNGTATFASGSAAVTGVGTSFTTDIAVGDLLVLQSSSGTIQGKVKTITDKTQLTLQANAASSGSGSYQKLLVNPLGVMYVRSEDLDPSGQLRAGVPVEPLILRANAGDCIEVHLTNSIDPSSQVFKEQFFMAPPFNGVNPISQQPIFQSKMSGVVGLHPQLLSYDSARSNGMNIGWNRQGQTDQLAKFGQTVQYQWYAGKIDIVGGAPVHTPVEFGSLNLFPSDQIYQNFNGLFGQMIIEPAGSTWLCGDNLVSCDPSDPPIGPPPTTRAAATVTLPDATKFRDFALMISDDIRIVGQDPAGAVNYRTEPKDFRYTGNGTTDFSCMLSNQLVHRDPQTAIFTAAVGDKARFRFAHPFGTGTSQVFVLNGHVWQRNPYKNDSKEMGDNSLSQWIGSRDNHGSTDNFDLMVDKAGGESGQAGDYLYSVFVPIQAKNGAWGVFRVGNNNAPGQSNAACTPVKPVQPIISPAAPQNDLERFIRQPVNRNPKP
jgi:hypothetical protein